MYGEAIGVVVVLKLGVSLTLFELRKWLMGRKLLQDKWCPEVMVRMPSLPMDVSGKPARINLANKLKLESLDGALKEMDHPGLLS